MHYCRRCALFVNVEEHAAHETEEVRGDPRPFLEDALARYRVLLPDCDVDPSLVAKEAYRSTLETLHQQVPPSRIYSTVAAGGRLEMLELAGPLFVFMGKSLIDARECEGFILAGDRRILIPAVPTAVQTMYAGTETEDYIVLLAGFMRRDEEVRYNTSASHATRSIFADILYMVLPKAQGANTTLVWRAIPKQLSERKSPFFEVLPGATPDAVSFYAHGGDNYSGVTGSNVSVYCCRISVDAFGVPELVISDLRFHPPTRSKLFIKDRGHVFINTWGETDETAQPPFFDMVDGGGFREELVADEKFSPHCPAPGIALRQKLILPDGSNIIYRPYAKPLRATLYPSGSNIAADHLYPHPSIAVLEGYKCLYHRGGVLYLIHLDSLNSVSSYNFKTGEQVSLLPDTKITSGQLLFVASFSA